MRNNPLLSVQRQNALLTKALRKTLLSDLAQEHPEIFDFDPPEDPPASGTIRAHRARARERLEQTMYDFNLLALRLSWVRGEFHNLEENPPMRRSIIAALAVIYAAVDDHAEFSWLLYDAIERFAVEAGAIEDAVPIVNEFRVDIGLQPLEDSRERVRDGERVTIAEATALHNRGDISLEAFLDQLQLVLMNNEPGLTGYDLELLLEHNRISAEDAEEYISMVT